MDGSLVDSDPIQFAQFVPTAPAPDPGMVLDPALYTVPTAAPPADAAEIGGTSDLLGARPSWLPAVPAEPVPSAPPQFSPAPSVPAVFIVEDPSKDFAPADLRPNDMALTIRRPLRHNVPRLSRRRRPSLNEEDEESPTAILATSRGSMVDAGTGLSGVPMSLRERGTAFFFARYVATDHGCYQNFDFVYEIWKPPMEQAIEPDCVTASMTAVGLAGLAKLIRCRDTMRRACESYGTALQLTNEALRNPSLVVKDSTMLAVLILGTYEFMGGRSRQTVRAWQKHVDGASALAKMRGTAQFSSRAGTRMFLMLCHSVLISCVQSDLPMPPVMVELRRELAGLRGGSKNPSWRVVEPIYKSLQIRHDIKIGAISDRNEILERLLEVEDEFAAIVAQLPRSWRYRRGQLLRPNPEVMGGWCHIYENLAQATTWNGMRTMRMLVQETIIDHLYPPGTESPSELSPLDQIRLARAVGLLERLGEALIASVPQHFGIVSARDVVYDAPGDEVIYAIPARKNSYRLLSAPPKPLPGIDPDDEEEVSSPSSPGPNLLDPTQSRGGAEWDASRFMTLATSSNTIIWPLYTIGTSSCCTEEIMTYAIDRLTAVHNETGLEQARYVIELLRGKVVVPLEDRIPRASLPLVDDGDLPSMV